MTPESVSYWQSTSPADALSTTLPRTVDVAVVGGGLLGAATCYWLAREGAQVALLERAALASGATGRNGGLVRAGSAESYPDAIAHLGHETVQAVMTLTYESRALLRQVLQEEHIACDYREPGTVKLALNERQVERLQEEVELLHADGFPARLLDRNHVQAMINTPLASEILGGRLLPEQGLIHPARLVHGLMQAALRREALASHAEVLTLVPDGQSVFMQTSRGHLRARAVVVAVNAWTSKLLPGFTDIIVPVREQMLAYAPTEPLFSTGVTADLVAGEYWQQTHDGTILVGGCGSVAPGEDIGIWESQPTTVVQEAIEQILPRLFPSLSHLQVVRRWAGLMGSTSDSHPIVDRVPSMPGVFVVGGFSGHGMPFGMRFGQLLATAVMSGVMPSALEPYRLNRQTLRRWRGVLNSSHQSF
jgi:glycine/D-amino acid oxidase-like deaminating enzyme